MTPRDPARSTRLGRWRSILLVAFLTGAGLAGARSPVLAQAERLLAERQGEYDLALKEYDSRKAAWDVQERRFQRALDDVRAAKRSGNAERLESAYQTSVTLAVELARLRTRVEEVGRVLDGARKELLSALDQRQRGLEDQLARARSSQEQRDLTVQIRDLENQYQSLAQGSGGLRATLVFWPEVDAGPLDGVEELRAKVEILERKFREAGEEIAAVDQEISRLEGRQRLERRRADASLSRDRFGDTNVPVGPQGSQRDRAVRASADTAGVPLHERPLDQQIASLRSWRSQLELMREQLSVRATSIRGRLPRTQQMGGGR